MNIIIYFLSLSWYQRFSFLLFYNYQIIIGSYFIRHLFLILSISKFIELTPINSPFIIFFFHPES